MKQRHRGHLYFLKVFVDRLLQQLAMRALTNPHASHTSNHIHAQRLAPAGAVYNFQRRARRACAHASSNDGSMQPVAGASTQQLQTSSVNGQQQPAPQQPSRIVRYAGLTADDFRCVKML